MSDYVKIHAVVLAGERPGCDPLAAHFRVSAKALIAVDGVPMVTRVARMLAAHPTIADVHVTGSTQLAAELPPGVTVIPSCATIASTIGSLVDNGQFPLLVTTADHPLLDAAMIDSFVAGALGQDLAVGVVERATLLAIYPKNRRTWLRFRGGAYSGANLFWLGSANVQPVLDVWAGVEQRRKRGRALLSAFGPTLAIGTALRLLTIHGAMARLGRRFGLSAAAVVLPQPEACIDVDSVKDHALVEAILAGRSVP